MFDIHNVSFFVFQLFWKKNYENDGSPPCLISQGVYYLGSRNPKQRGGGRNCLVEEFTSVREADSFAGVRYFRDRLRPQPQPDARK